MAEQVEAAVQGHVEVGGSHRQGTAIPAAGRIEAGEQDPLAANQLGVVVVEEQHLVEPPWQGSHPLAAQHGGGGLGLGGHGGGRCGGSRGWLPILGGHRPGQNHGQQRDDEHRDPLGGKLPGRPEPAGSGAGDWHGAHGFPTRVRDTVAAMARISSAERGSLKGPFTMKAATARWPFGIWMREASA